ncbi:phage fiber-tail adaptor protein [Cobetia marina]|uniref:phage fiber-tail adaptor protein n=1 Tax=Cobetia marina TaxID=28258 RepID=UPI001142D402|nr:hypothetical protein [Cobetia marina]GED43177.1 hypothetical protein HHA02_25060 [Cobetia marina]
MKTFRKQPRDHLDYDIVMSEWLSPGDEVENLEIVDPPAGIEVTQTSVSPDRVKLWITGGEDGQSYKFTVLVYTESRTKEVDFLIVVTEL